MPRVSIEDQVIKGVVPEGSRFKGHEPFLVQDLVISARATCYLRERWVTPDGGTILAPLPEGIDGHFGPELRRFVLMFRDSRRCRGWRCCYARWGWRSRSANSNAC
jgi:hypothetical protein